jgi:hypothetical protein
MFLRLTAPLRTTLPSLPWGELLVGSLMLLVLLQG